MKTALSKFEQLPDGPVTADIVVTSRNTAIYIGTAIILTALALRLWGIWNVSATDEYNEVLEALRVGSGHLNFMRWGKRVYLYLLAVEYGIYFALGWILDIFQSRMDFAAQIVRNMEPLFIIGRITSALCGTLTVAWLYQIGRRFFNPLTGMVAAILLSITVFHIDLSQQAKVDALLGLFVVGVIYFTLKIATGQAMRRDFVWCGALTALAIQTKINTVVLGGPLLVALVYHWRDHGASQVVRSFSMYYMPAFLVGFLLGNPPVLIAPHKYLQAMLGVSKVYTEAINENPSTMIGFLAYPFSFYRAMGFAVCALAVGALVFGLLRPNRRRALMLAFILPFYLVMGASRYMVYPYYIIPALPFLYLLMGDLIASLWTRIASNIAISTAKVQILFAALGCLMLVPPVISAYRHSITLTGPNTRYLAKQWIEANIPADSKILMDSGKSINSSAPLIAENRATLERILSHARSNIEQGKIVNAMVDSNALIYYELLLQTVPPKAYDITSTMFGLELEPVDYYLENGYDYFIISKSMKEARTTGFSIREHPQAAQFYASLEQDPRLHLIHVISPGRLNRGDTFLIYRLDRKTFDS
jgi:hypothetical protein